MKREKRTDRSKDEHATHEEDQQGSASKPISLHPLSFEEALGGLLETDAKAVRGLEREAAEKREAKKK